MGKVRTRLSEVLHQSWGQRSAGGACTHWGVLMTLSPPPPPPLPPPSYYSGDDTQLLRTPGIAHRVKSKPHKDWNSGWTFAVIIWLQSHPSTITWYVWTTKWHFIEYLQCWNSLKFKVVRVSTEDSSNNFPPSLKNSKTLISHIQESKASRKNKTQGCPCRQWKWFLQLMKNTISHIQNWVFEKGLRPLVLAINF